MAITVIVESAPSSRIKGYFHCKISSAEVMLVNRKSQISIPIGSEAQYERENRLVVSGPDGTLQLIVQKVGSYENRLAKDLARLIGGEISALDEAKYRVPWFFWGVSAIPLGVPFLTGGGSVPTGLGVAVAAGCFVIVQKEDWSVGFRLIASTALVALGYVGLVVLSLLAALLASA